MESSNSMLWSDRTGSQNTDIARGVGIFCDYSSTTTQPYFYSKNAIRGTGDYGTIISASAGDVISWSFDYNNRLNAGSDPGTDYSRLDIRFSFTAATITAGTYLADFAGGSSSTWVKRTGSYTLTADDAFGINNGKFDFGIKMTSDGDTSIYADNFELSVTTVPEPATMALLGLGGFFIRRRKA